MRYQLVGTYDGATFTVSRADLAPPASGRAPRSDSGTSPGRCARNPEGGWELPDPSPALGTLLEPVDRLARAAPDFAGLWISYLAPMGNNVAEDPGEFVLNVAFTGELARHQAQLRPRWGGRLCVTRQQRSYRELLGIQRELQGDASPRTSACGCWAGHPRARPTR